MKEVLKQLEDGLITAEEAEALLSPKVPTATISVGPDRGITVKLENWTGVSMTMLEQMYHQLMVAVHRYRANGLTVMRTKEIENVAD